jgi:hypothetical protein
MSGPLAKAALVEYRPTSPPIPVVTVFQYNPESLLHTWHQAAPAGKPGVESSNPLAVRGLPGESFEFTIYLNADDDIVSGTPSLQQAAEQSGVGARLAALEMLLYPVEGTGTSSSASSSGLLGTASAGLGSSGSTWQLPNSTVPVILFYWNANRVVPVRVTTLSVTETLYDEDLKPRHAQAQLSLRVLTPEELAAANPTPGSPVGLAVAAYNSTLANRRRWADANTSSPAGSIISQLPH